MFRPFHRHVALCAVLVIAMCTALQAAGALVSSRLNDTGIGLCIGGQAQFISCKGTGQDAALGRDVTRSRDADGRVGFHFTRYCNNGEWEGSGHCPVDPPVGDGADEWGCTRDDVTRLLWETKTASGQRAGSNVYTFYSADYDPVGEFGGPNDATGYVTRVNAAGLCGRHDWRLPTPTELMGIADMGVIEVPAIDLRFMPNTQANGYWGAGNVRDEPAGKQLAWDTSFSFSLGDITPQFRSSAQGVRLVHGASGGGQRFVISGDEQEVTDLQTSLTWRRCVEGMTFQGDGCTGTALVLPWIKTLAHARQQAHHTDTSWRLPNVKELASLLDHKHLPHIDVTAFPGAENDTLWTSSSFPTEPTPRCIDFTNAISFSCSLPGGFASRLVKDSD